MNERIVTYAFHFSDPVDASALGDLFAHFVTPFNLVLVHVSAAPMEDDTGATLDIHDDGTAIVAALACADADVPGEWAATGYGGTNDPVLIGAGSEISFDLNNAAAENAFTVVLTCLAGEVTG